MPPLATRAAGTGTHPVPLGEAGQQQQIVGEEYRGRPRVEEVEPAPPPPPPPHAPITTKKMNPSRPTPRKKG